MPSPLLLQLLLISSEHFLLRRFFLSSFSSSTFSPFYSFFSSLSLSFFFLRLIPCPLSAHLPTFFFSVHFISTFCTYLPLSSLKMPTSISPFFSICMTSFSFPCGFLYPTFLFSLCPLSYFSISFPLPFTLLFHSQFPPLLFNILSSSYYYRSHSPFPLLLLHILSSSFYYLFPQSHFSNSLLHTLSSSFYYLFPLSVSIYFLLPGILCASPPLFL